MSKLLRLASVSLFAAVSSVAFVSQLSAGHDRDFKHDAEGRAVVDRLRQMGFVQWRDIDGGRRTWNIDDARRDNGHVYDLQLERGSLDVVRLKREDF